MSPGSGGRRWVVKGLGAVGINAILSACADGLQSGSGGGSGTGGLWPIAPVPTPTSTPTPTPTPTPGVPQPIPFGPTTNATVSVTTTVAGAVPAQFSGLSYSKTKLYQGMLAPTATNMVGIMRALGSGNIRMNSEDVVGSYAPLWNPAGAGLTFGSIGPSDIDRLAGLARATGWKVIYDVQLAGSTPSQAASEAAYAVQSLGDSLLGIEIGNEPDQYARASNPYPAPAGFSTWTYAAFLSAWREFRAAILQSSPNAPIVGPATGTSVSNFFAPFARDVGSEVVQFTHHYYRADGAAASSTSALMVTPDPAFVKMLGQLAAASNTARQPFRLAEANNYWGSGSPTASPSYAAALWVIDFLFEIALGGGVGVNINAGTAAPMTPVVDNGKTITAIRPEYFGMLLFAMAGQGSLLTTSLSATGLNATAYCIQTAAGKSVVIVNKDSLENLNLTLTFPGAVNTASAIVMTGPSLTALTGVEIQGATMGVDGSLTPGTAYALPITGGSSVQVYAPPLTAVLVKVT